MIAHEGYRYIMPVTIVAAAAQYLIGFYALPLWLAVIVLLYLFREPRYTLTSDPLALLSPTDSTVISVSNALDPYLNRDAIRIEFDMGLTDTYILRSVTEGKIANFWLNHPDKSNTNRLVAAWIRTDEDDDAVMEVYPGRTKQMMCYYAAGERVGQGKKCGFLPFGAKVVVYLPENSVIDIKPGDRVTAGKDIIAHWGRS